MLEIHCSQLARPMVCAGSLFFENLPEQETHPAAKEGTAAGEYLRALLERRPPGTHASNGVAFDDDMLFYLLPIANEIDQLAASEVLCEQRIDWMTRSGILIAGQYDASYVGKDGALYVDDLKYGFGVVEVKPNWQLLGYAIGEALRRQQAFEKIVLRIHQPRAHHEDGTTRAWVLTWEELLEYKEQIESRMADIAAGLKDLVTSEKCKYCPAAASACPAISKAFHHGIDVIHHFLQDDISEKELSRQLDLIGRVNDVLKIKKDSLEQLAVSRIKGGKIIPGYLTEASYGDRKWKSGITADVVKALTGKRIVKEEMLSPAQAEKAGVHKEFVNALVDRHFIGQKLKKKDASDLGNRIFGKVAPS